MQVDHLKLYFVMNGQVTAATAETECDGTESILVAATSEAGALVVADAFDRGEAQMDNLCLQGTIVGCVWLKDETTGLFV
jgi:hypothetical protein